MMKWVWRFSSQEQTLRKVVISEKLGLQGCWITKPATTSVGVRVWKNIRSLWASGTSLQVLLGFKWVMEGKSPSGKTTGQVRPLEKTHFQTFIDLLCCLGRVWSPTKNMKVGVSTLEDSWMTGKWEGLLIFGCTRAFSRSGQKQPWQANLEDS